ncbi:MAG: sulfopyruvate decarboxylase subunit beta [Candidatus Hydrothermarchaeales archaeon]
MKTEEEVVQILKKGGVDLIATLPCDKAQQLYNLIPRHFRHVPLTREEEGVGICAGAHLAGVRPLMLIQSSGMGNMINALGSLTKTYCLPLPILISWRGVYKEKISAQVPMGKYLPKILKAFDINYSTVEESDDISLISGALEDAYQNDTIHAVLLSPNIWRESEIGSINGGERRVKRISPVETEVIRPVLTRFKIIQAVAPYLDGKVVVCNLGIPCKELYSIKHQEANFYMLGSLGMASPIGLGIAMNTGKHVVVIDGDGSLLMNPGTLATIACIGPENLTILAIDNGVHGSTGSQPTATECGVDLELTAKSFGLDNTFRVWDEKRIHDVLEGLGPGPNFVHIIAKPGNADVPNIPLTPLEIKQQVMEFLRR